MHTPPRWLRRIIASCLPVEDERVILGELDSLYDARRSRAGALRANWWYARQSAGFVIRVGATRLARFVGGANGLRDEVRYAARALARRPAFSAAFVLTLAVGTGVVCTVYTAARWVLLRPVPHVRAPEELFTIRLIMPKSPPQVAFEIGNPDVEVMREHIPFRDALAALSTIDVDISRSGSESRRVPGELVSANYFSVLGTPLVAGRSFVPAEDHDASIPPAVVSAELAEALTGTVEGAVGTDLRINGAVVRIVGVTPRGFRGNELPGVAQIWLPLSSARIVDPSIDPGEFVRRGPRLWTKLIVRPPAGWTASAIEREANAVAASIRKQYAFSSHSFSSLTQFFRVYEGIGLDPGVRVSVTRTLAFLSAASILLLLLATANLANLTLIRATLTTTTTAIRYALGASWTRIARGVLVDALVLAVMGTTGALILAGAWSRWYGSTRLSEHGGPLAGMHVDPLVLGVTLGVAIAVSVIAFIKPVLMSRLATLDMQLRRGTAGAPSHRLRRTLVAIQVALSVMLLIGAGLLGRTVANLRAIDLGFDPDRIITLAMDPHLHGVEKRDLGRLARDFDREASRIPGVSGAGFISPSPMRSGYLTASLDLPGTNPEDPNAPRAFGAGFYVSSGFFQAAGARVIAGQPRWTADSGQVILTRSAIAKLFPGESPAAVIGRTALRRKKPVRVIAVIEDLRLSKITAANPNNLFFPIADRFPGISVTAFVSSPGKPTRLVGPIRAVIASLAPELPAYDVRTARDAVDQQFAERAALARAATTLGAIGLLLATLGLYGVLANYVAARKREIGIRAAMGAAPRRIVLRVLRDGLVPVSGGMVIGAGGAIAMTKVLQSQLYAVQRWDNVTWIVALLTLSIAATTACLVPALRALRVSPSEVLRDE
jgi:predicted permease